MRTLALILLASCGVPDLLDGDIEDRENCCYLMPRTDAVRSCVVDFLEPNHCAEVTCLVGAWESEVCREGE